MDLLVKNAPMPEVGKYDVTVFDDPISNSRRIMINKHLRDEQGRVIGDYPMFDVEKLPGKHGRLIDADELLLKIQNSGNYLSPAILAFIETAETIIDKEE